MKKFIWLLSVMILFSCSKTEEELDLPIENNEFKIEEGNENYTNSMRGLFCPIGYTLVLEEGEAVLQLLKKPTRSGNCSTGFGFCFGINLSFKCERTPLPEPPVTEFDPTLQAARYWGYVNENGKLEIHLPEDMRNLSSEHSPSDFDALELLTDREFGNVTLLAGSYPLHVIDDDLVYYVDFEYSR